MVSHGEEPNIRPASTDLPRDLRDIVAIEVSPGQVGSCLALRADGTVVAWGNLPAPPLLTDVVDISIEHGTALALRSDGSVVGWSPRGVFRSKDIRAVAIAAGRHGGLLIGEDGKVCPLGSYIPTKIRLSFSQRSPIASMTDVSLDSQSLFSAISTEGSEPSGGLS